MSVLDPETMCLLICNSSFFLSFLRYIFSETFLRYILEVHLTFNGEVHFRQF